MKLSVVVQIIIVYEGAEEKLKQLNSGFLESVWCNLGWEEAKEKDIELISSQLRIN